MMVCQYIFYYEISYACCVCIYTWDIHEQSDSKGPKVSHVEQLGDEILCERVINEDLPSLYVALGQYHAQIASGLHMDR